MVPSDFIHFISHHVLTLRAPLLPFSWFPLLLAISVDRSSSGPFCLSPSRNLELPSCSRMFTGVFVIHVCTFSTLNATLITFVNLHVDILYTTKVPIMEFYLFVWLTPIILHISFFEFRYSFSVVLDKYVTSFTLKFLIMKQGWIYIQVFSAFWMFVLCHFSFTKDLHISTCFP